MRICRCENFNFCFSLFNFFFVYFSFFCPSGNTSSQTPFFNLISLYSNRSDLLFQTADSCMVVTYCWKCENTYYWEPNWIQTVPFFEKWSTTRLCVYLLQQSLSKSQNWLTTWLSVFLTSKWRKLILFQEKIHNILVYFAQGILSFKYLF